MSDQNRFRTAPLHRDLIAIKSRKTRRWKLGEGEAIRVERVPVFGDSRVRTEYRIAREEGERTFRIATVGKAYDAARWIRRELGLI